MTSPLESAVLQVLVVEEEPLIRWAMTEMLQQAGHAVHVASSAWEALECLQIGLAPDVVLLDLQLPGSHDLELLATIRQRSPDSAVILATAYGTPEVVRGATQLGAVAVVNKPLDMMHLADMVVSAQRTNIGGKHA